MRARRLYWIIMTLALWGAVAVAAAAPRPPRAPPEGVPGAAGGEGEEGLHVRSNVPGLHRTVSRDPAAQTAPVGWRGGSREDCAWGREDVAEGMRDNADEPHSELGAAHGGAEITATLAGRTLRRRGSRDTTGDREHSYVGYRRDLDEHGARIRPREGHSAVPREGQ